VRTGGEGEEGEGQWKGEKKMKKGHRKGRSNDI